MANAEKEYPLGGTMHGAAVEADTSQTTVKPFSFPLGSVSFTQSGGTGVFKDNGNGTFDYTNDGVTAEIVKVSAKDTTSNPSTTLEAVATGIFGPGQVVPNQLDIQLT